MLLCEWSVRNYALLLGKGASRYRFILLFIECRFYLIGWVVDESVYLKTAFKCVDCVAFVGFVRGDIKKKRKEYADIFNSLF